MPVRDWLAELQQRDRRAFAKCVQAIERLALFGHELRRPHAARLRDGIYELRDRQQRVNYRILYFFYGQNVAVLAPVLTKAKAVPIDRCAAKEPVPPPETPSSSRKPFPAGAPWTRRDQ